MPCMSRDALKELAHSIFGSRVSDLTREPGYLYGHGVRVASIAEELYSQTATDGEPDFDDTMFAGALFHDVGKGFPNHHVAGAEIVKHVLESYAARIDLDRVATIIASHCLRDPGNYGKLEIAVVQDADIIDHFGGQGVWIALQRAARRDASQFDVVDNESDDIHQSRLKRHIDMLNFDSSKAILSERCEFERSFFIRLRAESNGGARSEF